MRNSQVLRQIWGLLERLDAAVVTRDPGSARSAEAYDGLRKQLNQASKNRRMHVSHLLSLSDSIERGAEYQLIKDRVSDFMLELGVRRTTDVGRPEFFEVTSGEGEFLQCTVPAVVETLDDGTVSLVRLGEAVRVAQGPPGSVPSVPRAEVSDSVPNSRGMKVAIGITIAIVGFFFGWIIATTVNDDADAQAASPTISSQVSGTAGGASWA